MIWIVHELHAFFYGVVHFATYYSCFNKTYSVVLRKHGVGTSKHLSLGKLLPFFSQQTNGETWNQNNLRLLCSSPAEHRASTVTQSLGSASVRSSPSNSTTSGDTDSALVFPCSECGK